MALARVSRASEQAVRKRQVKEDAPDHSEVFRWQYDCQAIRYDRPLHAVVSVLPQKSPVMDCSTIHLSDAESNLVFSSIKDSLVEVIHGCKLRELNLADCDITLKRARVLGGFLMQNTTLQKLSLRGNPLGEDGVKIICTSLLDNLSWQADARRAIETNALRKERLRRMTRDPLAGRSEGEPGPFVPPRDDSEGSSLAHAPDTLIYRSRGVSPRSERPGQVEGVPQGIVSSLLDLDLSATGMTAPRTAEGRSWLVPNGLRSLSDFLMRPECRLQALKLSKNRLSEFIIEPFLLALRHNSTLRLLEIEEAQCGPKIAHAILDIVTKPVSVATLKVAHDEMPPASFFLPSHEKLSRLQVTMGPHFLMDSSGLTQSLPPLLEDGELHSESKQLRPAATSHDSRVPARTLLAETRSSTAAPVTRGGAEVSSVQASRGMPIHDPLLGVSGATRRESAPRILNTRNALNFPWLLRDGPCFIEALSLRGCEIGDEGAEYVKECMQRRCRLRHLNVSRNEFTAVGFRFIALALRTTRLQSVDVANNNVGVEGAKMLAEALKGRLITLRSLRAASCRFTNDGLDPAGALALAEALRENRTLAHLDLSNNSLVLQKMGFHPTPLVQSVVYRFADALRDNRTLMSLNLSKNWVGLPGQRALRDAIRHHGGVVEFAAVVKDTLERWLTKMLWRQAESRFGPYVGSNHPVLAPVYRGYDGGARFDVLNDGALGAPRGRTFQLQDHQKPVLALPWHSDAHPPTRGGAPLADELSPTRVLSLPPMLASHSHPPPPPMTAASASPLISFDNAPVFSVASQLSDHRPAAHESGSIHSLRPGERDRAAMMGKAPISLAEAMALVAAGPTKEDQVQAKRDRKIASRRAKEVKRKKAAEQRQQDLKNAMTKRLKPLPSIPALDMNTVRQAAQKRAKPPKRPPPKPQAPHSQPPSKPLPVASTGKGLEPTATTDPAEPRRGSRDTAEADQSRASTPTGGRSAINSGQEVDPLWFFEKPGLVGERNFGAELKERTSVLSQAAAQGLEGRKLRENAVLPIGEEAEEVDESDRSQEQETKSTKVPPPPPLRTSDSARSDWRAGGDWAESERAFIMPSPIVTDTAPDGDDEVLEDDDDSSESEALPSPDPKSRTSELRLGPLDASRPLVSASASVKRPDSRDWRLAASRSATASAASRNGFGSPEHVRAAARDTLLRLELEGGDPSALVPVAKVPRLRPGPRAVMSPISDSATTGLVDKRALQLADEARARDREDIARIDPLRTSVVKQQWSRVAPGYSVASQSWLLTNVVRRVFEFLEEQREVYFDDPRMEELNDNAFATKAASHSVLAAAAGGPGVERPRRDGKMNLTQTLAKLQFIERSLNRPRKAKKPGK
jgi:hypothetical protein